MQNPRQRVKTVVFLGWIEVDVPSNLGKDEAYSVALDSLPGGFEVQEYHYEGFTEEDE